MSGRTAPKRHRCLKQRSGWISAALILAATFAWTARALPTSPSPIDRQTLIRNMEAAYDGTKDYRTTLVVTGFGADSSYRTTHRLAYVFKKPNRIRIDFEYPHEGMTIVYPDHKGKVAVRPMLGIPSFVLHFKPESRFVEISPGQRIDQTDLGLLIANISRCSGALMIGDLQMTEDDDRLILRVLSDNPFARGTPTRYTFTIDKRLWLPVAVEESTATGVLKRRVVYEDLRTNTGVRDGFFHLG